jgi:hypothetical protein
VVVGTRDWLPGRHVLIAPEAITDVSWEEKSVRVNATRAEIESSPEYDSRRPPADDEPAVLSPTQPPAAPPGEGRNMPF